MEPDEVRQALLAVVGEVAKVAQAAAAKSIDDPHYQSQLRTLAESSKTFMEAAQLTRGM